MRITGKVEVNFNSREVKAAGAEFARAFTKELGELTRDIAQRNISPGVGPGPHPHRPPPFRQHTDTGALRDSIQVAPREQGFLTTYLVWTDLDYGTYLEMGWFSMAGNFWRYPWMLPAVSEAEQSLYKIARSTGRAYFTGGYSNRRAGRVDISEPSFATFKPGIPPELR